tara:strand:+ start:173 stop:763 length:591 start_codon:yes stop_codon:yes gene_type:complete
MRKNSLDYKTVLNLYLAMPKYNRSVRELHRQLTHKYKQMIESKSISIPHLNTLWNWANKNNWKQLALEMQSDVEEKVSKRIVNQQVSREEKMNSIMNDLQDTSHLALKKIVATLKQDLIKPVESASELKALVNSVTDALKIFNVMFLGGVSSRSETISHNPTSQKLIKEQIIQLISSLNDDGIRIQMDEEDKSKLN